MMKNLHLYFGEEKLLAEDEIRTIKSKVVPAHLEMVNYIVLNGEAASEHDILRAMGTVPMMAEHKLVVVREARFFASGGKDNDISDGFFKFLSEPPEHTLTIFTAEKPDKRKKIFKLFQKHAVIKDFSKPSPKMKAQWIQNRSKTYGKAIDVSTAYYIGEYTENLFQADNELKKIIAYTGDKKRIAREDIEPIFSKSLETNIFKLTDFLGAKKGAGALEVFRELTVRGEKGIMILFMIAKHLMDLASVKSMAGKPAANIQEVLELHPFVLKKALDQSRNFTLGELDNALKLCQKTDLDIKTGKTDERFGIELLITKICG